MKKLILPFLATFPVALTLLLPCHSSAQTTHTWIGNWGDAWDVDGNWDTNSVPATDDSLIFTGNNTSTYNSLTSTITLRHITFDANAGGSFEVDGNAFNVGGTITNNSDYEVAILNDIQIVAGGGIIPNSRAGGQEGLILDVGHAGIRLAGTLSFNADNRAFVKTGVGALTITGTLSATANANTSTIVNMGDLTFSGATVDMGRFVIGSGWSANTPEEYASARILVQDNATASATQVILRHWSGNNTIAVEAGSTFTTESFFNMGNGHPDGNYISSDRGLSTLNIDLTAGGQFRLSSGTADTILNKHWITLTEMVGGVKKTGFVYIDSIVEDEETILIATRAELGKGLTEMPGGVDLGNYTTHHVITSNGGILSVGTSAGGAAGAIRTLSLTIRGTGGTLRNTNTSNTIGLGARVILMEEGTGDFYLDTRWSASLAAANPTGFIYQHSTDGTLYFMRGINGGNANFNHLVKTGLGTVVVQSTGNASLHTGETEIREGRFVLDNVFSHTSHLRVRGEDAIFTGSGTIGGGDISGTPRYTQVQIFNGGTLDGTRGGPDANDDFVDANALTIHGSLLFLADGQYRVDLVDNANDPLTVLGTAGDTPQAAEVSLAGNLILTLDYGITPYGEDPIILLRTDGSISGVFDTINGSSFINGNLFTLTFDTNEYWLQIDYNYDLGGGFTAVALHAIPEPATVTLLAGLALTGVAWLRRHRKS